MVDEAEGANWADGTDETVMAEMALCMNTQFYFDCLGHKEFKNIPHICHLFYTGKIN